MSYNLLMAKHTIFLLAVLLFFTGCFNERGVSIRYYNNCEEYYDLQGYYHKKCDDNLIDYKDAKKTLSPNLSETQSKVW